MSIDIKDAASFTAGAEATQSVVTAMLNRFCDQASARGAHIQAQAYAYLISKVRELPTDPSLVEWVEDAE